MGDLPKLVEVLDGWEGPTEVRWICDPPSPSTRFRVIDEDWDADASPPVRTIYEVELVNDA